MIVLALLGGIWIAEFGGIDALEECRLYAEIIQEPIACKIYMEG
jgi:hypothetical protein